MFVLYVTLCILECMAFLEPVSIAIQGTVVFGTSALASILASEVGLNASGKS